MKRLLPIAFACFCFFISASAAPAASMNHGHAGKYSDKTFLSGMIGHHQDAVDMAAKILQTTRDADVRKWAADIIEDQKEEIGKMEKMLESMGGMDKDAHRMMRHMDMTPYSGKPGDDGFIAAMFDHHKGALEMSISALTYSTNKQVIKLADDIISAQADEMADFRLWQLKKLEK